MRQRADKLGYGKYVLSSLSVAACLMVCSCCAHSEEVTEEMSVKMQSVGANESMSESNMESAQGSYYQKPGRVLENAVLVTGGQFNHAALLQDGSVWTWGYNYTGNCGIAKPWAINQPVKVAENAAMVWTGKIEYNIDCQDITELSDIYIKELENTILLKNDGTYWICGRGIGEKKTLFGYWEIGNEYEVVCTSDFLSIDQEQFDSLMLPKTKGDEPVYLFED